MTYLLLAEKPSAAQNMAKALGGMSGTFNGQPYKIQHLYGHMMEFVEPHEMVPDREKKRFQSWAPENMPWDVTQLNWRREPQKVKDAKTGRITSKASAIRDIKNATKGVSAIVIATDKDPSGEGQLIGWEVIQAIGWRGPVKRMYFIDESEKELQKGFKNIVDLPSYDKDGEYMKAETRSRWDFLSMQLTRLSTHAARNKGYAVLVRQGRLKSVMTKLVADQLARIKAYKKKPYYEVKYKDENGNVYVRKFEDGDAFRFDKKEDAETDLKQYQASKVVQDSVTRKETAPGKLLDLGGLASILGTMGYKSKEVLNTYQKMYEARIVSYPRTEDKFISTEQFNEMLPFVDKIADVVGVDKALLTHRKPRKTHVKDGGAHGANRPGQNVPVSLDALQTYGPSAKAIYEILAKNFLAMFGENYVYDSIKGHIESHPAFTTTINVPIDLGFKAIFDADKEISDDDLDQQDDAKGLGKTGQPFVAEGVNKKPPYPTHKWLEKQLSHYDVGTGATRVSTLSEVTSGKSALLTDTKGKLALTKTGEIAAVLLEGSQIGDPAVTEKLFKAMKDVGAFKVKPIDVLQTATALIQHDKEVFYRNAEHLREKIGEPDASMKQKIKAKGVYKPLGKEIVFNKEWSGHTFTDEEVAKLLNGDMIEITAVSAKSKKAFKVGGKLEESEYKGKRFWGFRPVFKEAADYTIETAPFPESWSGYTFTKADEKRLRNGEKIKIKAISAKSGKPFEVDVTFEIAEYNGVKRWRIVPHFEERKPASAYTRENAPFKPEFSGYKLTEKEIQQVRAGEKIMVTAKSKKGKTFTCNLSLELKEYNGHKFWGLEAHFN